MRIEVNNGDSGDGADKKGDGYDDDGDAVGLETGEVFFEFGGLDRRGGVWFCGGRGGGLAVEDGRLGRWSGGGRGKWVSWCIHKDIIKHKRDFLEMKYMYT